MAYITTQEVAQIRNTLKAAFPDFRFSVRREHGSSVYVTITKGPIDFDLGGTYPEINPYYFEEHHPEYADIFGAMFDIIKNAGCKYFNESDISIDYHHVAFYYHLSVGSWNKKYQVVVPKKLKGSTDYAEAARTALAINELSK